MWKVSLKPALRAMLCIAAASLTLTACESKKDKDSKETSSQVASTKEVQTTTENDSSEKATIASADATPKYDLTQGKVSDFDIAFLKMDNEVSNKVYSPLSIKYVLMMLSEGSKGESKNQITALIGNPTVTKYESNENMSFANALFIRDTYKDAILNDYVNALKIRYNADVLTDSFDNAFNLNAYVNEKTYGIIPEAFDDGDVTAYDFVLLNALAIDMEWENKWLENGGNNPEKGFKRVAEYEFEKDPESDIELRIKHGISAIDQPIRYEFGEQKKLVSGLDVMAAFNRYDIVNVLGEENIRKIVGEAARENIQKRGDLYREGVGTNPIPEDQIDAEVNKYLDYYIKEIDSNYNDPEKNEVKSIDFSFYTDDSVKVFAKDLKEYNGTTLQYVGIMPVKENLDSYITKLDAKTLNDIIGNLKELKRENFKDGVITLVYGKLPKFKFDYDLALKEKLQSMGITDVFDQDKADLSGITSSKDAYIASAKHKADIEFTQDGIKAAAVTYAGGHGGGDTIFKYFFDVPIERIDLTFDKPYMFLIRDKETGDVWFAGTVYDPLAYAEDESIGRY